MIKTLETQKVLIETAREMFNTILEVEMEMTNNSINNVRVLQNEFTGMIKLLHASGIKVETIRMSNNIKLFWNNEIIAEFF